MVIAPLLRNPAIRNLLHHHHHRQCRCQRRQRPGALSEAIQGKASSLHPRPLEGVNVKRDMELIRKLLLHIEENTGGKRLRSTEIELDDYEKDEIGYHLKLLIDAGFTDAICSTAARDEFPECLIKGLTWVGHDFLDSVRNDGVWGHVKNAIKPLGTVPFEVMKCVAVAYISKQLGLP